MALVAFTYCYQYTDHATNVTHHHFNTHRTAFEIKVFDRHIVYFNDGEQIMNFTVFAFQANWRPLTLVTPIVENGIHGFLYSYP